MDQRLSFVTLAVADVARARRFYVDGLGWQPTYEDDTVVMLMAGEHLVLSLWSRVEFEDEVGPIAGAGGAGGGVAPFTLAHNVPTPADVDAVLEEARRAGAASVSEAVERVWGGYAGYFGDPDGHRWEVAFNPGPIGHAVLPGEDARAG